MDEHSPCGLSLTEDINFLWSKGLLLLPKFDNSSPSVTWDKVFAMWLWANFIANTWGGVPMEMYPFKDIYLLPKFDVSSFYKTGDIEIFKLVILLTLSSSKLIFILRTLGKSEVMLFVPFYWLWTGHSYFTEFGQVMLWKTIQTLYV